jgi:predicted DNA-binding transcriptional regulator AlpA
MSEVDELALAVDAKQLSRMLNICVRHIRRMDAAHLMPEPVKLGRCVRWYVDTIRRWVEAGCPSRREWEATQGGSTP